MAVAYRMGQPSQAVIAAGGNDRILPILVRGFLIYQASEHVIGTGDLFPIPVNMQGQISLLIIPEGFFISGLINPFAYLPKAVVTVFN